MSVLTPDVSKLASGTHGVLTTSQLLQLGRTRHQIHGAALTGELLRVHPGVYRVAAVPRTWEQRVLESVRAAGPGSLASHRSAAALWGLDGSTKGAPEVVTPRHLRTWAPDLGRCHESTDLHLAEPAERLAIPCTGLVRTLVDLGAVTPAERLQQAIDDAVRRSLCTWDDLLHALARHSRRGRRGVGPLRAILEECYGSKVPDSNFNRLVERLIIDAGLQAPAVEHEVRNAAGVLLGRLDLAYPEWRIGIELDSLKHHLSRDAFEKDRTRQNQLVLHGWTILRFSWRLYSHHPQNLLAEVATALRLHNP